MTNDQLLAIKQAVRERDGMRCTECGLPNDDHVAALLRAVSTAPSLVFASPFASRATGRSHAYHGGHFRSRRAAWSDWMKR
jgi:hypothetical protein